MSLRNPTCGCDPCESPLSCHPCCRCVPTWLCVTVSAEGDPENECVNASQELPWDGLSYQGSVGCGIDVRFTFERVGDECWFYLESHSLGYLPADPYDEESEDIRPRHKVTDQCRNPTFMFAGEVTLDEYDGPIGVTIETKAGEHFVNPKPEQCGGCLGCKCLPECFCAQVVYRDEYLGIGGVCSKTIKLCYDEDLEHWEGEVNFSDQDGSVVPVVCLELAPLSITLRLDKDEYTGQCELVVTTSFGERRRPLYDCPHPQLTETFYADDYTENPSYQVTLFPARCGSCIRPIHPCDQGCCEGLSPPPPSSLMTRQAGSNCPYFPQNNIFFVTLEYTEARIELIDPAFPQFVHYLGCPCPPAAFQGYWRGPSVFPLDENNPNGPTWDLLWICCGSSGGGFALYDPSTKHFINMPSYSECRPNGVYSTGSHGPGGPFCTWFAYVLPEDQS